mmetsp:Transcript_94387/g.236939  ORF Transcript_94387/g.236939 Transcript_94387/m.236939 type:complete len:234 (+) Transcript_94387:56-757(+)
MGNHESNEAIEWDLLGLEFRDSPPYILSVKFSGVQAVSMMKRWQPQIWDFEGGIVKEDTKTHREIFSGNLPFLKPPPNASFTYDELDRSRHIPKPKQPGWDIAPNATKAYMILGGKVAEEHGHLWYPSNREKFWHPGNEDVPGGDWPSCDGIASSCPFGHHTGINMCWRVSYRQKLRQFKEQGGFFVQVLDGGALGDGQIEEAKWAEEDGIQILHYQGKETAPYFGQGLLRRG